MGAVGVATVVGFDRGGDGRGGGGRLIELGLKVTCRWGLQFEKRDETTKAGGVRVVCALRFFLCTNVLFKKK